MPIGVGPRPSSVDPRAAQMIRDLQNQLGVLNRELSRDYYFLVIPISGDEAITESLNDHPREEAWMDSTLETVETMLEKRRLVGARQPAVS